MVGTRSRAPLVRATAVLALAMPDRDWPGHVPARWPHSRCHPSNQPGVDQSSCGHGRSGLRPVDHRAGRRRRRGGHRRTVSGPSARLLRWAAGGAGDSHSSARATSPASNGSVRTTSFGSSGAVWSLRRLRGWLDGRWRWREGPTRSSTGFPPRSTSTDAVTPAAASLGQGPETGRIHRSRLIGGW